ncbi:hypothetical protein RRG08_014532 [Elysia crispata]|uniref:Uncharacterized protein n=1 Tax=Elysia crispata TaxID=231223 RepID=A0AAE1E6F5_9GAST|nr:hypothetical protein RRG08_014532 [Elysia crispata]
MLDSACFTHRTGQLEECTTRPASHTELVSWRNERLDLLHTQNWSVGGMHDSTCFTHRTGQLEECLTRPASHTELVSWRNARLGLLHTQNWSVGGMLDSTCFTHRTGQLEECLTRPASHTELSAWPDNYDPFSFYIPVHREKNKGRAAVEFETVDHNHHLKLYCGPVSRAEAKSGKSECMHIASRP